MHSERHQLRDEFELHVQQRLRNLGQQRRRKLEFFRNYEQHADGTTDADGFKRHRGQREPDQFIVERGG